MPPKNISLLPSALEDRVIWTEDSVQYSRVFLSREAAVTYAYRLMEGKAFPALCRVARRKLGFSSRSLRA